MKLFKKRYRIVKGTRVGYEIHYKLWWFPFWILIEPYYTERLFTVNQAKEYIERLTNKTIDVIEEYNPHFKQ